MHCHIPGALADNWRKRIVIVDGDFVIADPTYVPRLNFPPATHKDRMRSESEIRIEHDIHLSTDALDPCDTLVIRGLNRCGLAGPKLSQPGHARPEDAKSEEEDRENSDRNRRRAFLTSCGTKEQNSEYEWADAERPDQPLAIQKERHRARIHLRSLRDNVAHHTRLRDRRSARRRRLHQP